MLIKLIENINKRNPLNERCQRKVRSQPIIGIIPEYLTRCQRVARYTIDEIRYCHQHAGEQCLMHMIENKVDNKGE